MSVFSTAYNTLRSTVGPLATKVAQSRGAVAASRVARTEVGVMRSAYRATSGNRFMRGVGAYNMYSMSSPERMIGTMVAGGVVGSGIGMAMAPHGRKSWGFWAGPVGGVAARVIPGNRRNR